MNDVQNFWASIERIIFLAPDLKPMDHDCKGGNDLKLTFPRFGTRNLSQQKGPAEADPLFRPKTGKIPCV